MIVFKVGCRVEAHKSSLEGEKITSPEKLAAIKLVLEKDGPVVLEHKFFRGARSPHVAVFDDYEELMDYLVEHARTGDKIRVWSLWPFMRDTAQLPRVPEADAC
jgi:hypothetical protein